MTEPSVPHAQKRRPDVAALIIAAALALLGAVIAWDAMRLGTGGAYARIGPQTVPNVIAVCLGVLAGVLAAMAEDAVHGGGLRRNWPRSPGSSAAS